jgi:hypothetical protein
MSTHRRRADCRLVRHPTTIDSTYDCSTTFILPLQDPYRISADEPCWRVERRKGKSWRPIAWHTSIEGLVNDLGRRLIRTSEVRSLADALAAIDRVACSLRDALEPHFKVERR